MNNLFFKELQIDSTIDYKLLFSNTKSSALDRNLNALLKYGVGKGEIKVKKYLLAENIANELFELGEWKVKSHKKIKDLLKDWHRESDASLTPILFILEKLEPHFKVERDAETKILLSNQIEVLGLDIDFRQRMHFLEFIFLMTKQL